MMSKRRLRLSAACLVTLLGALAYGGPKIVCETPTAEFGQVRAPQPITHRFAILNAGDEPLTITGIRSTCGTTQERPWMNSPPKAS